MGDDFEVSPSEARDCVARGEAILLDVREGFEIERASIGGSVWIPMREIPERAAEIPTDREVIVFCHHGARSAQVAAYLLRRGHTRVRNLSGGIDAWTATVDPSVPRY